MKYLAVFLSFAVAAPAMAQADDNEYDPVQAAQMICDVTSSTDTPICGEAALELAMRAPETIGDVGVVKKPRVLGASVASETVSTPAAATPARSITRPRPVTRRSSAPVDNASLAAAIIPPEVAGTSALMVTFANNSARLTEASQTAINSFAVGLQSVDELTGGGNRFRIEGHTDAAGADEFNQQLSEQRAQAVVDALVAYGIPAERFEMVGKGESEPLEGRRGSDPLNRRVVAVVLD